MNATDFTYDGQTLSSYKMMPVSFNGHTDDQITIGSDTEYADARPYDSYLWHYYGGQYSAPLIITTQIGINPCLINNGVHEISLLQERLVNMWLSPRQDFKELIIPYDDEITGSIENLYFFAHVTRMEKIRFGGKCIGFEVEFTTNAPYAFSEEKVWTPNYWTPSELGIGGSMSGTVHLEYRSNFNNTWTDSSDWIYPRIEITSDVEITPRSDAYYGALRFRNYQDTWTPTGYTVFSQNMFQHVYAGEHIVIDKNHEGITTSVSSHNVLADLDYSYSWFHFVQGQNTCAIWANTTEENFPDVKIYYREARKVGV